MSTSIDKLSADNMRILAAAMVEKAKSGHPGGAMGGADFVQILFSEFLNFDPSDMGWANRDRFFLDPGHMSPMLYSILAMAGSYSLADLQLFRQWGSPTPGHPELDTSRGVENTSGPLGQGHTNAVGAAIAERFLKSRFGDWMSHRIYAFISDGGVQEEISQGAGRLAGHLGLGNLTMFFVLVLRPADGAETTICWKLALENKKSPTALLLSRQGIKDVPALPGSTRYSDAGNASRGAYVVKRPMALPMWCWWPTDRKYQHSSLVQSCWKRKNRSRFEWFPLLRKASSAISL